MSENKYTKENIRARMAKLAAASWGAQKIEELDPLIRLLIESLSDEIYQLSDEVDNIEVRMLEKLAKILTPDILIAPSPAHAILHATPIEPTYVIKKENGLYYENPAFDKEHNITNLSFYPACNTLLHKGNIRYIVSNGLFYQMNQDMTKQLIAHPEKKYIGGNTVWIGLELDAQITSLEHFSFYIDFPNIRGKEDYSRLLPYTRWQFGKKQLKMSPGIYQVTDKFENEITELFSKHETSHKVNDNTLKIYHLHYMTVNSQESIPANPDITLPEELKTYYSQENVIKSAVPLHWLQIQFSPVFNERILEDIIISINAFPVENKKLYNLSYQLEDMSGIIPLSTGNKEAFLSIHTVADAANKHYYELSYNDTEHQEFGTYSLRHGGCERFDSRSAKDYLIRLIDLLSEESAAFACASRNKMPELSSQIYRQITQMQQAVMSMPDDREIPYYIIVDNPGPKEILDIKYWVTHCELGNRLRAGTELVPFSGTLLDPRYVSLMTPTYGGRQITHSREKMNTYKYILTTHDRIVTTEDIINFCHARLGEMVTAVHVSKGVIISQQVKEGLVRTIDVHITLQSSLKELITDENLKRDIENELIEKSPGTFNYRIILNIGT